MIPGFLGVTDGPIDQAYDFALELSVEWGTRVHIAWAHDLNGWEVTAV